MSAQPVRVLVLEDDPDLRGVLEDVLRARGLEVFSAARGEEALQWASKEPFDLIVADIRMDGMSGLDAIEKARELQPDMGSIVVSGYASEEETLRAVSLNVAGYLKKPFKIPQLLELINDFLEQRSKGLLRDRELRSLREALLWSLEQSGFWAEKDASVPVSRAAEVARSLAAAQGLDRGLQEQSALGAILYQLSRNGGLPMPGQLKQALSPFRLLLDTAEGNELASLSELVARQPEWPTPDILPDETAAELREAYRRFLSQREEGFLPPFELAEEPAEATSLLSFARALEKMGDLSGAATAYQRVIKESGPSPRTVQAILGRARLALHGGETRALELSIKELLAVSSSLGPVSHALAQYEGALLLRTAGHAAAKKLFRLAKESLWPLNLPVPWATCVVALCRDGDPDANTALDQAVAELSRPQHLLEVIENFAALLPDLLILSESPDATSLRAFCRELVVSQPSQLVSLLRTRVLNEKQRAIAFSYLQEESGYLPAELSELFRNDSDPAIRERAQRALSRSEDRAGGPLVKLYKLGGMDTVVGSYQVTEKEWRSQKSKYLFAYLVAGRPRSVSVERLLNEFWPENTTSNPKAALNTTVSNIRRLFREKGLADFDPVVRFGDTLSLHEDLQVWSDAEEMLRAEQEAVAASKSGQRETALACYARIARLYRGPYLEGCFLEWVAPQRQQYEEIYLRALTFLMESLVEQRKFREAQEYARSLLSLSPWDTRAQEIVLRSLIGMGEFREAAEQYRVFEKELVQHQASEPSTEMIKLFHMARYGIAEGGGVLEF